jgi:hypothetical protein
MKTLNELIAQYLDTRSNINFCRLSAILDHDDGHYHAFEIHCQARVDLLLQEQQLEKEILALAPDFDFDRPPKVIRADLFDTKVSNEKA